MILKKYFPIQILFLNTIMATKQRNFNTRAIHAGQAPDPLTGAIVPPVYTASTYVQEGIGKNKGFIYSRTANPTRLTLEACLADLEGAQAAFAFPSGLAAAATVLELMDAGSHLVVHDDLYGGIYRLFADVRRRSSGHQVSFVDFSDLDSVRKSIKEETKMLWFETPSNPLLQIVDMEKIAALSKSTKVISVCDNTFASPYCQRPLEHGIDMVVHSATKFLNGHSDLLAGVAAISDYAPEGMIDQLRFLQNALGSVLSPNDCATLLRSLKTLPVRMERHFYNAECIANFLLENQSRLGIVSINYPGLKDHPGHEIAKRQMDGFGSIITIVIDGGLKRADTVLQRCSLFHFAVSLGGVESLIQHPASMTHAAIPRERREKIGLVDGLIRLSVGIESIEDLIGDLEQALQY